MELSSLVFQIEVPDQNGDIFVSQPGQTFKTTYAGVNTAALQQSNGDTDANMHICRAHIFKATKPVASEVQTAGPAGQAQDATSGEAEVGNGDYSMSLQLNFEFRAIESSPLSSIMPSTTSTRSRLRFDDNCPRSPLMCDRPASKSNPTHTRRSSRFCTRTRRSKREFVRSVLAVGDKFQITDRIL